MGEILALAERFWRGEETGGHPFRTTGATEEIAPGVFFHHVFANVTALPTDGGLVLVDTGSFLGRQQTFEAVRRIERAPLHAAIYTHGHVDHACGLPPFLAEARDRGWPRPRIVGHRNVAARFDRYRLTAGWNGEINTRQFGVATTWPRDYDYPDVTYDAGLRFDVGGSELALHHALGETDDHTWIHWEERRVLWTGDQFIWASPNAGNPQKVQRYAAEWAVSLRAMSACGAEVLIPGHGVPILGAERVRQALGDTAAWLEHLERETVARMNAGMTLDAILHEVEPPRELAERPYLREVYDESQYVVRNVWRRYGGWYDGVPSRLKPAPDAQVARELAGLAGGVDALVARARALAAAGDMRLASHLVDLAVAAAPEDGDAHAARADVYERRAAASPATMTKGIFGAAARESRAKAGAPRGRSDA
jgi:glyoxylase-like metal-dependent hydrolase (beta-lactamase superfamily II)